MARVMAWNVMRIGNLGRMGVLWTLALLYSYLHLLFLYPRLRRSPYSVPQSRAAASDLKPASIVTGASSGIGKATAIALALQGFHVILAGRSLKRLREVVAEIQRKHKDVSVQALELDLCLVPSILSFVKTIQVLFEGENPPGKLQLLVNNAGILATSQRWTSDEFDCMMASNYLGPYMLTCQLLPLLYKNAPRARIVNVVSFTHRCVRSLQVDEGGLMQGTLQTSSYNGDWYSLARIYETSKLCMLLFSYELHRRLHSKEAPSHISVMAADPGAVASNILREMPHFLVGLSNLVLTLLTLLQSPTAGAASVVDAALAPWEISGKYYFGGRGLTCQSSQISYNRNLANELWEASAAVSERVMSRYGAN
ncbi:hypothetical protein BDL97_03G080100 [Sphagnum fallax]|nr:hypothetical protein BDL97_03G080100 [Sphagnum fallax]